MSSVYLDQADKQQFQTQALTRVTVQSVSLAWDSTSQLLPLIGQSYFYITRLNYIGIQIPSPDRN